MSLIVGCDQRTLPYDSRYDILPNFLIVLFMPKTGDSEATVHFYLLLLWRLPMTSALFTFCLYLQLRRFCYTTHRKNVAIVSKFASHYILLRYPVFQLLLLLTSQLRLPITSEKIHQNQQVLGNIKPPCKDGISLIVLRKRSFELAFRAVSFTLFCNLELRPNRERNCFFWIPRTMTPMTPTITDPFALTVWFRQLRWMLLLIIQVNLLEGYPTTFSMDFDSFISPGRYPGYHIPTLQLMITAEKRIWFPSMY